MPWVEPSHSREVESFSQEEAERIFEIFLDRETLARYRGDLAEFAERVERLPIAVVVAADLLRREFGPLDEASRGLRLESLRNEVHDVPDLLQRAVETQPERERELLGAMAVCAADGFWLPLAGEIVGLDADAMRQSCNRIVNASSLRLVDRERQRFQLHGLLREQLRKNANMADLQAKHVAVLEKQFRDWESHWRECHECLPEVIPAMQFLWEVGEAARVGSLAFYGFAVGWRIGELETGLRILREEERFWAGREDKTAKWALPRNYGNQGEILQAWGCLEEAMTLHKKEEALCVDLGNKRGLAASYGGQAQIFHIWGRLDEAMALFKKAEVLCLELGDKQGLLVGYGNQALVLQDCGRSDEAMRLLEKAEALCVELRDKDVLLRVYGNRAVILRDRGRPADAMYLLRQVEALCLELGDKDGLLRSYGTHALILKDCGQLAEAMHLFQKAEALCLELGDKEGLQATYANQASILKAWGRLNEAMSLHKKEEALCLELGLRRDL